MKNIKIQMTLDGLDLGIYWDKETRKTLELMKDYDEEEKVIQILTPVALSSFHLGRLCLGYFKNELECKSFIVTFFDDFISTCDLDPFETIGYALTSYSSYMQPKEFKEKLERLKLKRNQILENKFSKPQNPVKEVGDLGKLLIEINFRVGDSIKFKYDEQTRRIFNKIKGSNDMDEASKLLAPIGLSALALGRKIDFFKNTYECNLFLVDFLEELAKKTDVSDSDLFDAICYALIILNRDMPQKDFESKLEKLKRDQYLVGQFSDFFAAVRNLENK
ncbi:hypothetical protein JEM51_08100 [Ligilactobacillus agilis]|uniref:hypothetical protein n=1 Tax=Ligilactobacillus agilis TaxID=1601 RepID=UPI00191DFB9B|nr:hypothetical protein [Ligilactobacillus agilis]MBL1056389.1 hypothetical protein [Ligilactobacillus agilis]